MTKPNAELLPEFTQDELTVMQITGNGAPILAIGRWEKPCVDLTKRGFLKKVGIEYHMTPAGGAAIIAQNQAEASEIKQLAGEMADPILKALHQMEHPELDDDGRLVIEHKGN